MNGIDLLGATLLHFLWQGILIAAVYAAARRCVSRPETRYLLACAALAAMAAAPVVTWIALRSPSLRTTAMAPSFAAQYAVEGVAIRELPRFFAGGYERVPSVWLSCVAAAWMVGILIFCLRFLGGWTVAERLRRRQVWPVSRQWQQVFDRLRVRLRVSRPVCLLVSGLVHAPAVVGVLRPVVLVPVGALAGLPAEQIEAVLLHELAHVRRYDNLVNMLQRMVETVLFYHPAIWWVSDHMRSERELCCDDAAITVTGDAQTYARALAQIGSAAQAHYQADVAANGGSLANRVARLLGVPRPVSRASSPALLATAALVAITLMVVLVQTVLAAAVVRAPIGVSLTITPALRTQSFDGSAKSADSNMAFQVASVKESSSGNRRGGIFQEPGGRLIANNATLKAIISTAYELDPQQMIVGPESDRLLSQRFDIEAKAQDNPTGDQMNLMLQSLLADRFKLVVHHETRQLPVFALVLSKPGKIGTQLVPHTNDANCPDHALPNGASQLSSIPCGDMIMGRGRMTANKISISEFAASLSGMAGRSVQDRTGLTGTFDLTLKYTPEQEPGYVPGPDAITVDPLGPSLFTALQEQLGLKLDSQVAPVDVVVIDHIAEPTPN